ncbi:MEF2BNB-like protein [Rhynchospora pubera]|uniref:MEF2BNB-like protein n=1 Tax=Rhynchospora pubera TaxID=906938 RepID=A0AAV8GHR0_9POAL|nr:MEF2BNB-like protein [Rhynchospora pubera]KAJ4783898.1 MEF2BNB-like protein [Rhynchospora pubera]KAJ4803769.1 MEF2BNB-like protein [Rhynchospora pubera]
MHAFSPAEGFIAVKEGVDEMLKYLANEPSVGLYFVQHHAQASMPNLLSVKEKLAEEVHEVTLHTEDIEDSICVVRSMAEIGLPIADDMIKDINRSLRIMSSSPPKRGLIQNPSWGFQFSQGSSLFREPSSSTGPSNGSYFSAMFKSAKLKAASFKWTSQQDIAIPMEQQANSSLMSPVGLEGAIPSEELAESSRSSDTSSSALEEYDKFKLEQELKLQEWLEAPGGENSK